MFQNSTLPSVSVDITQSIAGSLPRLRAWQGLARLDQLLPLPKTFGEYLVWMLMMAGVTALALLQISTTLQISQTQAEVYHLRGQYVLVEQQNAQLLWDISQFTTLERVESEAVAAGFVPALNRRYVSPDVTPGAASGAASGAATDAAADITTDAAVTLAPRISANPASVTGQPALSNWSVEIPAESIEMTDAFANRWDDWSVRWTDFAQGVGQNAAQLRDAATQQWLKIDLSRYLWIGTPSE